MDIINVNHLDERPTALICAVTIKGHLHIFTHQLDASTNATTHVVNGGKNLTENKLKKPIKSSNQIQIETHDGTPLKIYATFITNSQNERLDQIEASHSFSSSNNIAKCLSQQYLYIIYGSHLNPKIEKFKFSDLNETNKVTLLKSDDSFKTSVSMQIEATKIETPSISKDLKVLMPGY